VDQKLERTAPTLQTFNRNIADAGLKAVVEAITRRSYEVSWEQPVAFLFIDGLHDYPNVSRDFLHFERWVVRGGCVAFHDYADYYPGVKTFVDELVADGQWEKIAQASSLVVITRRA